MGKTDYDFVVETNTQLRDLLDRIDKGISQHRENKEFSSEKWEELIDWVEYHINPHILYLVEKTNYLLKRMKKTAGCLFCNPKLDDMPTMSLANNPVNNNPMLKLSFKENWKINNVVIHKDHISILLQYLFHWETKKDEQEKIQPQTSK